MNKKKTIGLVAVIALIAVALIGTTLAYFTDTDNATNTMTVGNVKIKLIEEQREIDDETGQPTPDGDLEEFEQDKVLMPIVGSAQGEKDSNGLPTAGNYVDKVITVENTGSSDALVRVYFAIPAVLDDGYDTFNAGKNVLHFNFGTEEDGTSTDGVTWNWKHGNKWNYYETTLDGVKYNVYYANYMEILPADETTTRAVNGVYLDKTFDAKTVDGEQVYYAFGSALEGIDDLIDDDGNLVVTCPVYALAVQAAGFDVDDADAAFDAAFGEKFDPFNGTGATNWQ